MIFKFKAVLTLLLLSSLSISIVEADSASTDNSTKENEYVLKALEVDNPPEIDGYLEPAIWQTAPVATNFIQKQPDEGRPATEETEVRILYDNENLYIGVMCFDSNPEKIIANEKKRDSQSINDNDHIQIMLDTFHDRRNGYVFTINPLGAKLDQQIRKEGKAEGGRRIGNPNVNTSWDGVWDVRALIHEKGWSAEIAIPFVTLRFNINSEDGWGLNFLRNVRRKNEESTWMPLPRNLNIQKISIAGELTGLEGLKKGLNLQVKPYVMPDIISQRNADWELKTKGSFDAGLDFKYGLTSNLTMDVTVNTDFSQVEADDQQINLTRFSLYFPEKREFFLENSAIFSIGGPEDSMIFFSRRIGISDGEEIPLLGGVKLAGKIDRFNMGIINMQTRKKGDIPSNNFTVIRLSRDILGQSAIGFMATNRQSSVQGDYNRALAIDGDFIFGKNLSLNAYFAMTDTPNLKGKNKAFKFDYQWKSDLIDVYGDFVDIQENFNAEMGFTMRTGIRRAQIHAGYTPEPNIPGIRRFNPHIYFGYTTDQNNRLLFRHKHVDWQMTSINGGNVSFSWNELHEYVDFPFPIQEDITIPIGLYTSPYWQLRLNGDKSKRIFGSTTYRWGDFYGGKSKILDLSTSLRPFSNFSSEISLVYNDVDLPQGSFVNHILRARFMYNFSTQLALMSLFQWNSNTDEINTNIRLSFIHRPGSYLYVVYNERRLVEGIANGILDRTFAVKFNYLFNF